MTPTRLASHDFHITTGSGFGVALQAVGIARDRVGEAPVDLEAAVGKLDCRLLQAAPLLAPVVVVVRDSEQAHRVRRADRALTRALGLGATDAVSRPS